jgi:uncharacterized membrane protein YccC
MLLSLLPVIAYAQNQDNSHVQELYAKSGIEKELQQLPSAIQVIFDQSVRQDDDARKLPREVLSAMRASLPQAFATAGLKETMLSELAAKLTAQDIKDVLQWLDSPLGRKCTQLEEAASTAEAQAEMMEHSAELRDSPPTPERLKALREFDAAVQGTQSAVDMAINTQVAVALAINATFPAERRMPLEEISRELEKNRPILEATVRSEVLISQIYTYKSLTEAELQRYTEFAKSPSGSKYQSAAMNGFKKAILKGAVKWGELIGNAIKEAGGNREA